MKIIQGIFFVIGMIMFIINQLRQPHEIDSLIIWGFLSLVFLINMHAANINEQIDEIKKGKYF